jgi:predicted metal-dependent hydrolase
MVDAFMSERAAWLMRAYERQRKLQPKLSAKEARALYAQHKERARALVHKRLAHFNTHYQFQYRTVAIRNQRTRWGSCSRKGNLNFSYKLALMRPEVADYVIVHELCHLREFNHSSRFWALVAETVPNYNALRKELRAGALM